jgi:hypothetical protein
LTTASLSGKRFTSLSCLPLPGNKIVNQKCSVSLTQKKLHLYHVHDTWSPAIWQQCPAQRHVLRHHSFRRQITSRVLNIVSVTRAATSMMLCMWEIMCTWCPWSLEPVQQLVNSFKVRAVNISIYFLKNSVAEKIFILTIWTMSWFDRACCSNICLTFVLKAKMTNQTIKYFNKKTNKNKKPIWTRFLQICSKVCCQVLADDIANGSWRSEWLFLLPWSLPSMVLMYSVNTANWLVYFFMTFQNPWSRRSGSK